MQPGPTFAGLASSSSWCLERAAVFVIVVLPGLFSFLLPFFQSAPNDWNEI